MSSTLKTFPDYVSPYPYGRTTDASIHGFGNASLGSYQFDTGDSADTVSSYYQKLLTSSGFTIVSQNSGANDNGSTANFVATRANPTGNFTLSAETQSYGKVRVNVAFTMIKQ